MTDYPGEMVRPSSTQPRTAMHHSHSGVPLMTQLDDSLKSATVFRYLDEEKYADEMCNGQLWLSTLDLCRNHPEEARRDSGEAIHSYEVQGQIVGNADDASFLTMARRLDIEFQGTGKFVIQDGSMTTRLPDAHVLCLTRRHSPAEMEKLGRFCVAIESPLAFFKLLTRYIAREVQLTEAVAGRVQYRNRTTRGLEAELPPIGFVKPPDRYEHEQEVRMLWRVPEVLPETSLKRIIVDYPPLGALCRRIS